jgi:uncharacterized membrane protein
MLKLDMSEALSRPETIINNNNIFQKEVIQTRNNNNTTCLDLLLKRVPLSNFINSLGNYNFTSFTNVFTPERRIQYTFTDYAQPCPAGWSNQNGNCMNWWNYNGPCDSGRWTSGFRNCRWEFSPRTCQRNVNTWVPPTNRWVPATNRWVPATTRWVPGVGGRMVSYSRAWWFFGDGRRWEANPGRMETIPGRWESTGGGHWESTGGGRWENRTENYQCGQNNWRCDPYTRQLPGSDFRNSSNNDKKNWSKRCKAPWPQATRTTIIPPFWTCNLNRTLENTSRKIGIIPRSQDPQRFAVNFIFQNNILPNQNAFFAYYLDGGNYHIFLSNTSNESVFTNQGVFNQNETSRCQGVNSNLRNFPVSVFRLNSAIYRDGNFSQCSSINNSINNINQMNSNSQKQQFNRNIQQINERFTNYEQNQYNSSTKSVQQNLNEIIKNLTDNYNQKAQIYNSTADAIKNHDRILSKRNNLLNKQSEDLLKIQDDITLKTREIELNHETSNKQLFIKRVMQGSFILFPLIILMLILMYYQAVGPYMSLGMIGLLVVGYIIYVVVINNRMKVRQFLKPVMGTIQQYENVARQVYNDIIPPVCKGKEKNNRNLRLNRKLNISILNSNGPFYYYDGSAPPEQVHPTPIGSIQFDTGDGIVVFPQELAMSLDNYNNIMLSIFFQSWIGIMMKNGINLNDPQFLRKLDITNLEDVPTTYNLPLWENIGLPLTADFQDNIKVKCSKYNDIRSKSGKNASIFLVDTWNFFLGDKIPNDIYQKWLKRVNSVILRNGNLQKVYFQFYEFVIGSKQFREKYPPPNGMNNFIQTKFTEFLNFLSQNVKFAENPSLDLNFNLR